MDELWREADFVGGHPALDFLNTISDTGKTRKENKLQNWSAVRRWAVASKLVTETDIRRFTDADVLENEATLAGLIHFREIAYAAMIALAGPATPDHQAISRLKDRIREAITRSTLGIENGRFRWQPDPASRCRWQDAIALAFEDLLRSEELERVRQCKRCTWFFVDRGRGRGRRWCDMRTCGNRAKAQSHRASQMRLS
ncbi:MAG: CGNR zinc finger domain-containing protein [Parvibaculaceae bacterium]